MTASPRPHCANPELDFALARLDLWCGEAARATDADRHGKALRTSVARWPDLRAAIDTGTAARPDSLTNGLTDMATEIDLIAHELALAIEHLDAIHAGRVPCDSADLVEPRMRRRRREALAERLDLVRLISDAIAAVTGQIAGRRDEPPAPIGGKHNTRRPLDLPRIEFLPDRGSASNADCVFTTMHYA